MKKLLLLAFQLGFLLPQLSSQSTASYLKSAKEAFAAGDYATTYIHAKEVLKRDSSVNLELLKMAMMASVEVCEYDQAEQYMQTISSVAPDHNDPVLTFYRAKNQHRQGNYEEAIQTYNDFIAASGSNNQELVALAKRKAAECDQLLQNPPLVANTSFSNPRMLKDISTPGQSDFAMPIFNNNIIVGKLTPPEQCECEKPCSDKISLYERNTSGTANKLALPKSFKKVGHITYAKDGQRAYFTSCQCKDDSYTCEIYYADRVVGGEGWSSPVKLPPYINHGKGYTSTQPFYLEGRGGENDTLFYVSDFHGESEASRTDLDIFYSVVVGDDHKRPVGMEAINTTGDEVTPFFHKSTNTLFFSSNGHMTLGGYDFDIFKYIPEGYQAIDCSNQSIGEESSREVLNMGSPINTQFDDLFFSKDEESQKMIFSSNREGEDYAELQHCCPDVFEVQVKEPTVDMLVFAKCKVCDNNNFPNLDNLNITALDTAGQKLSFQIESDAEGVKYRFSEVPLGQTISFTVGREGFHEEQRQVPTGICPGEILTEAFDLQPKVTLNLVFEGITDSDIANDIDAIEFRGWLPDSTIVVQDVEKQAIFEKAYVLPKTGCNPEEIRFNLSEIPEGFEIVKQDSVRAIPTNPCGPTEIRYSFKLQKIKFNPLPLYFYHAIPRSRNDTVATSDYSSYFKTYLTMNPVENRAQAPEETPIQAPGRFNREISNNRCATDLNTPEVVEEFFVEVKDNLALINNYADNVQVYMSAIAETPDMIELLKGKINSLSAAELNRFSQQGVKFSGAVQNEIKQMIAQVVAPQQSTSSLSNDAINKLIDQEKVILTIQGVASVSALNSKTYSNSKLAKRRIDSMKKYLAKRIGQNLDRSIQRDPDLIDQISTLDAMQKSALRNLLLEVYNNLYRTETDPQGDAISNKDAPATGPCRIWDIRASRDRRIELTNIIYPIKDPKRSVVIDLK